MNATGRASGRSCRPAACLAVGTVLAVGTLLANVTPAIGCQSCLSLGPDGGTTFCPGLRVQTRYVYDDADDNNDFYTARVRFKGRGDVFGIATYYTELKIDNTGRNGRSASPQVENAWLNFAIDPAFAVRAGFYDIPFSRDALTSDSKLLMVDRSLIKDGLTSVGFADNTIGVLLHGRPGGGRFEYSGGVFDNLAFEADGRQAGPPTFAGRVALNLLEPASNGGYADYRGSYLGRGRRLAIGASGAYLSSVHQGTDEFDLSGVGIDVFFTEGPVILQGELGRYARDYGSGSPSDVGEGGFAQGGMMMTSRLELTARFQQFDPSSYVGDDRLRWTSVGANVYIRDHNLKVQTDYTIRKEQGAAIDNNFLQIQLQLDF